MVVLTDYVIVIAVILFIIFIIRLLGRKNRIEHEENIKAGLGPASKRIEKDEQKIKKSIAGTQLKSKKTKKKKTSAGATKLAISGEKLDKITLKVEEVTISLIADLKNMTDRIKETIIFENPNKPKNP